MTEHVGHKARAKAPEAKPSRIAKIDAKAMERVTGIRSIRGVRDLLPPETTLWNHVEQTAREVFSTFGFGEIRLPIIERISLFSRSIGSDTDIVTKEMYSFELQAFQEIHHFQSEMLDSTHNPMRFTGWLFELLRTLRSAWESDRLDRTESNETAIQNLESLYKELYEKIADDRVLSKAHKNPEIQQLMTAVQSNVMQVEVLPETAVLRPEATASVCRAYIEHGMHSLPQPVKLYYMGPMFRRERPQKGRYRQFYQIGAEVLEVMRPDAARDVSKDLAKDAAVDAEVIEMLTTFFDRVGLVGTELSINSIGHAADNCRRGYVAKLREELTKVKDRLGPDSQRRIETNPLRVLDSKLEGEQKIIEKLPRIADHLCKECAEHYAAVKRELHLRGVKYQENWRLVRGLDYYMRTTFEITARGLGSQDAVCGGGRYDGLVELLGGPPTKGIGFAIGEDRLILSLQEARKEVASGEWRVASGKIGCDVYVAWMGQKAYATAIRAAKTLRAAGFSVELPPVEQKFGKALGQADKLGARYALILGDNEVASGEWTLKTLATGEQAKFTEPSLLEYLRRLKKNAGAKEAL